MENRVFDLTILDHSVELVISDDVQDTDLDLQYDYGYCNIIASQIWINRTMSDDLIYSTIWHELHHYISQLMGLVECTDEEPLASAFGAAMHSLFKNNREFVHFMLGGITVECDDVITSTIKFYE